MSWASYQIRKLVGCACAGNAGNVFTAPDFKWKPVVSDPGIHHGTCLTHMPWYMSGSLTRGDGKNVPGIPGACATRNFTYLVRGPCNNVQSFFFYISLAHPFTRANNVTCYYGHKYIAVLNYAVCKNIISSGANFKIDINLSIINLKLNIVTFTAHIVFSTFFVYNDLLQILLSCIYLLIWEKKVRLFSKGR